MPGGDFEDSSASMSYSRMKASLTVTHIQVNGRLELISVSMPSHSMKKLNCHGNVHVKIQCLFFEI